MRKLEQIKNLEPHVSYSFEELSDILLQNYKDSTSVGSGSFLSGINNLKEKQVNDRFQGKDSISSMSNWSDNSEASQGLTQDMLKQHNILEAESTSFLKGFNIKQQKKNLKVGEIQEDINEDDQDEEEMMLHEQKRRANKSASKEVSLMASQQDFNKGDMISIKGIL
jgi:hypothetical protein